MLFSCEVKSLIYASISPCLLPLAMLNVIFPLTLVSCAIHVDIHTVSVSFIIDPVSLVYISIYMNEFSMTMCAVVSPLALVASAVRPNLHTVAVSETSDPLALVSRTCLESVKGTVLSLGLRIILLF